MRKVVLVSIEKSVLFMVLMVTITIVGIYAQIIKNIIIMIVENASQIAMVNIIIMMNMTLIKFVIKRSNAIL